MLLCNLVTELILMKVHNMTTQEHAIVDLTLVVCYHAHCSYSIYGLLANIGGIAITCDSVVLKC